MESKTAGHPDDDLNRQLGLIALSGIEDLTDDEASHLLRMLMLRVHRMVKWASFIQTGHGGEATKLMVHREAELITEALQRIEDYLSR